MPRLAWHGPHVQRWENTRNVNLTFGRTKLANLILNFIPSGVVRIFFWKEKLYTYRSSRPFCLPDDPRSSLKGFANRKRIAFLCGRKFNEVPQSLRDMGKKVLSEHFGRLNMILNDVISFTHDGFFPRFDGCLVALKIRE